MFKHFMLGLAALFSLTVLAAAEPSHAQGISFKTGVCDPQYPTRCVKPNADGSINTSGGGGGGGSTTWLGDYGALQQQNVTTSSANYAFTLAGGAGSTVLLKNTGQGTIHYHLGANNTVAATLTDDSILPGNCYPIPRGSNLYLAVIGDSASQATWITGAGSPPNCSGADWISPTQLAGQPPGAANFTPAQVSVGTTATLIAASRTGRQYITVCNNSTTDVFLGGTSGVTTSTGQLLLGTKGSCGTFAYQGALYGIVGSGTDTVSVSESY